MAGHRSPEDRTPRRLDALLARFADRVSASERRRLAAHVLDRSTAWVVAHGDHVPDPGEADRLSDQLERRAAGEPLHYLIGEREFYGRTFKIGPAVLIPRPETEHLVDALLGLDLPETARIVDVGTGSGCIALTLACERRGWTLLGTDVSRDALAVAELNRKALDAANATLLVADLLAGVDGPFDAVVSNPPYIAPDDPHLGQGDLCHEPRIALTDSEDGLSLIHRLIEQSFDRLAPGGWLWLEHGHDQAAAVRALLLDAGFDAVESRPDLAGIERISGGRRPA